MLFFWPYSSHLIQSINAFYPIDSQFNSWIITVSQSNRKCLEHLIFLFLFFVSINVSYGRDLLMLLIISSDFFKPCSDHLAPLFPIKQFAFFFCLWIPEAWAYYYHKTDGKKCVVKSHDHEIFQSSLLMTTIIIHIHTNRFCLSHFSLFNFCFSIFFLFYFLAS